jgi:hypothetical protein
MGFGSYPTADGLPTEPANTIVTGKRRSPTTFHSTTCGACPVQDLMGLSFLSRQISQRCSREPLHLTDNAGFLCQFREVSWDAAPTDWCKPRPRQRDAIVGCVERTTAAGVELTLLIIFLDRLSPRCEGHSLLCLSADHY